MQLLTESALAFYAIVLGVSILSSAIGTGAGFLLIPIAALFFGPKEGIGMITLFFLFQNTNKMLFFRKSINTNIGIRLLVFAIPGAILGSVALGYFPAALFQKIFAVIILLYLLNEMIRFVPRKGLKEHHAISLFGLLYGFLSGLVGSGNIIKGPLFAGLGLTKEAYIGTYAFTSFFINIPKIATYLATGTIDHASIVQALPLLILSIVGTAIGRKFLRHINDKVFYWILHIGFGASAIALLVG